MGFKTVPFIELRTLCINKLEQVGVSALHAETVTEVLLHANLRGVDSHGIMRLEHYIERIKAGGINPRPNVEVEYRGASIALVDGDDGLGHLAAIKAMEVAIELGKKNGIALVGVNNSSHCGALSYYVNMATREKLIGIAATNTDKMVVPFGGTEPFFGTNPFAFGFPAGRNKPVIMDMATSSIAYGKILHAKETGSTIPDNCAVNERGECTISPDEFVALLPFGGPKGYGISMIVDIFSGILVGTAFGPHVRIMYGDLDQKRKLGHFIAAIDIGIFTGKDNFINSMDQLVDELHAVPPAVHVEKVLVPGEPEHLTEEVRRKNGIPLAESIYNFLLQ